MTLLCVAGRCLAQQRDTIWLTAERYVTEHKTEAAYYRLATPDDSGLFHVEDYRLDGTLALIGGGHNALLTVREGHFTIYDSVGHKEWEGSFLKGLPNGVFRKYFPNTDRLEAKVTFAHGNLNGETFVFDSLSGKTRTKGNYHDNLIHGAWTWFFPGTDTVEATANYVDGQLNGQRRVFFGNGKLQRDDFYENGRLKSGKCFSRSGKEAPYVPELPGSYHLRNKTWNTLLNRLERIARDGHYASLSGQRVHIRFILGRSGAIRNGVVVSGPPDRLLRRALLQVMRELPDAKPYKVNGRAAELQYDCMFEIGPAYHFSYQSALVQRNQLTGPIVDFAD